MKTRQCAGRLVADGETRCAITRELDALGFCKWHSPLALQCRGVAKGTGQRCRIKWDLDANVLCEYHTHQRVACHYVLESGDRCGRNEIVNHHGFCASHPPRTEDLLRDFALLTINQQRAARKAAKKEKKAQVKAEVKPATHVKHEKAVAESL